jgi:hypothetical protein
LCISIINIQLFYDCQTALPKILPYVALLSFVHGILSNSAPPPPTPIPQAAEESTADNITTVIKPILLEQNLAPATTIRHGIFHFPRCVYVGEDPPFDEAVYPLKRLETAFTYSRYYLHMIAFQGGDRVGRRSIKQTNSTLVSPLNL